MYMCARMKRFITLMLLLICELLLVDSASAQYYSWGVDPPTFKWRQMKEKSYRVVYPDTAEHIATRMMYYLDAVNDDISYGYRHPQMSIPFVVHPSNFASNAE